MSDRIFLTLITPITSPLSLNPIRQQEFAQLDYSVMLHAFECQNQLGRLCDEQIYQNDLAARLEAADVPVRTEVPVTVTCGDFTNSQKNGVRKMGWIRLTLMACRPLIPPGFEGYHDWSVQL